MSDFKSYFKSEMMVEKKNCLPGQAPVLEESSFLEELINGIIHEINNPLFVIKGKALQLSRRLEEQSIEEMYFRQELTKIANMSTRITKILTGLRSLSQNSEGDDMEHIDVFHIVQDAVELCNESFRDSSVKLNVKCETDISVYCRHVQISQILLNLLNNAFQAVEGTQDSWVSLEVTQGESSILFSVTDSGKGIPPEIAARMSRPFFTTKRPGRGMGLGLSLSKKMAEDHRGILKYDSTSINTRFVLELPIVKNEMKAAG